MFGTIFDFSLKMFAKSLLSTIFAIRFANPVPKYNIRMTLKQCFCLCN